LAGLRTAESLRKRGFDEAITLLGAESHLPYDRPPLSKNYLSQDKPAVVPLLRAAEDYAELGIDVRLGTTATGLDPQRRRIRMAGDEEVPYDTLVIATGAHARTLPLAGELDGFRTLRTLSDADLLRSDLDRKPRVLVLGAGFIGAEVAAAARQRDLETDMVEVLPAPMSRAVGTSVGELLGRLHSDNGVRVHCGVTVASALGSGRVEAIELSDGVRIDADLVVLGLGVIPATDWLAGSGLEIADGVACDSSLRAIGWSDVYAVGDVARWRHPHFDESLRIEHWTNANEHADVVASAIVGEHKVAGSVPYVWSDQYGQRIQIVGRPKADDDITVIDDPDGRHVAVYERAGRVVGVLTVDAPRTMLKGRRAIAAGTSAAELMSSL
jgi:NADPH-dependent 2,4-dienoyl-CoA reductase/sulfur reductase-like enzyme